MTDIDDDTWKAAMQAPASPSQIKQARQQAGLTQQAASDLLSVSIKTVQSWEGGWRNMPAPMWRLFNLLTGASK